MSDAHLYTLFDGLGVTHIPSSPILPPASKAAAAAQARKVAAHLHAASPSTAPGSESPTTNRGQKRNEPDHEDDIEGPPAPHRPSNATQYLASLRASKKFRPESQVDLDIWADMVVSNPYSWGASNSNTHWTVRMILRVVEPWSSRYFLRCGGMHSMPQRQTTKPQSSRSPKD
jgi:hypothetical protein